MRILITGGTGLIGKRLINKLSPSDELIILTRRQVFFGPLHIKTLIGDMLDKSSLIKACKEIDVIIHMAAVTHTNNQNLYFLVNTEGTKNLIEAAQEARVKKFIFVSSRVASVSGGAYAHSKLLAERALEQSGLNWVILKPSEVYGTDGSEAISKLISFIKTHSFVPIIGKGNHMLNPVYIDDVIQAIVAALHNDTAVGKSYILSGPEEMTYNELIETVLRKIKVKKIKIYVPIFAIKLLAYVLFFLKKDFITIDQIPRMLVRKSGNISLAEKDLNFHPRSFEEGIFLKPHD